MLSSRWDLHCKAQLTTRVGWRLITDAQKSGPPATRSRAARELELSRGCHSRMHHVSCSNHEPGAACCIHPCALTSHALDDPEESRSTELRRCCEQPLHEHSKDVAGAFGSGLGMQICDKQVHAE